MTERPARDPGQHRPSPVLDRPVADVAGAIIDDHTAHGRDLPPAADPLLEVMLGLATKDLRDPYGSERVADVVRAALSHLHDWHGTTAERIRHELERALDAADRPAGAAD